MTDVWDFLEEPDGDEPDQSPGRQSRGGTDPGTCVLCTQPIESNPVLAVDARRASAESFERWVVVHGDCYDDQYETGGRLCYAIRLDDVRDDVRDRDWWVEHIVEGKEWGRHTDFAEALDRALAARGSR